MNPESPKKVVELTERKKQGNSHTTVNLNRLGSIDTYEVMESELDQLEQATDKESRALAFFMLLVGAFLSGFFSLFGVLDMSQHRLSIYLSILIPVFILCAWFGLVYIAEHKRRKGMVSKIRQRK